jgi:ATP-binding cassette, subfamily F, member 3
MRMTTIRADTNWSRKAKRILSGLSFREKDFDRPLREMSGGWVMRAHLARLLVQEPDVLMLDEPTNHLDLESLQWFQEYLRNYTGRDPDDFARPQFSQRTGDAHGGNPPAQAGPLPRQLRRLPGTTRGGRRQQLLAAYKNQQREIAHMMEFVQRFRAKNTKAAQAQSKLKQIERMEKIEAPVADEKKITSNFPSRNAAG